LQLFEDGVGLLVGLQSGDFVEPGLIDLFLVLRCRGQQLSDEKDEQQCKMSFHDDVSPEGRNLPVADSHFDGEMVELQRKYALFRFAHQP
jgi:hypothetical protein